MDTTHQYIDMCEKATEIQGMWKPKWGDFVYYDGYVHPINIGSLKTFIEGCEEEGIQYTWLPRQDQLQEMTSNKNLRLSNGQLCSECLSRAIYHFVCNKVSNIGYSMEQVWLAFVMHEKFNKKWDDRKWVEV